MTCETPSGFVTIRQHAQPEAKLAGFETSFVGSGYRFNFRADATELVTTQRAIGCVLMSIMPSSGLDDAVHTLWDTYQFASEDEHLIPHKPIESMSVGIAAGQSHGGAPIYG